MKSVNGEKNRKIYEQLKTINMIAIPNLHPINADNICINWICERGITE